MLNDDFDTDELSTQLDIFSSNFMRGNDKARITLREAIGYLQNLSSGQHAYYTQVCKIAQLILVMAATSAASERSFSGKE